MCQALCRPNGDLVLIKKDKHPCLHGAYVQVSKDNKYISMSKY